MILLLQPKKAEWFETGHVPLYKYTENPMRQFGVKEQLNGDKSSIEESQGIG